MTVLLPLPPTTCLHSSTGSVANQLHDLGKIIYFLCASIFPPVNYFLICKFDTQKHLVQWIVGRIKGVTISKVLYHCPWHIVSARLKLAFISVTYIWKKFGQDLFVSTCGKLYFQKNGHHSISGPMRFMSLYPLSDRVYVPFFESGQGLVLINRIWQKWWRMTSELGHKKDTASILSVSLSLSFSIVALATQPLCCGPGHLKKPCIGVPANHSYGGLCQQPAPTSGHVSR